jgi:hypothetical protein
VKLPSDKLFMVPGNHDLDRTIIEDFLPSALQHPLTTDKEVHDWLGDKKKRDRLLEPFEAYQSFVSRYTGQSDPAFASILRFETKGFSVGMLGLNSAWMSGRVRDRNNPTEIDDARSLLIGEPQLHDALEGIAGDNLRIVVMHHPFDWLNNFDRNHVEERVVRSVHFTLCGHQHVGGISVVAGTGGNSVVVPAGASYDRRLPENPRYTNGYNLVKIDPSTGQGVIYFRTWGERRNEWIEDVQIVRGGRYEFRLPSAPSEPPKVTNSKAPQLPVLSDDFYVDPYAAQILDQTARALLKLLDRTSPDDAGRAYDFYHVVVLINADGSGFHERHFQLRNVGSAPISMLKFENNLEPPTDESFRDLNISITCKPQPLYDAVYFPTKNTRQNKWFALAFLPAIAPGEFREVVLRHRIPAPTFRRMVAGQFDDVGVEIDHEAGITDASFLVQLSGAGELELGQLGGATVPASYEKDSNGGHLWRFANLTPKKSWHFNVELKRTSYS